MMRTLLLAGALALALPGALAPRHAAAQGRDTTSREHGEVPRAVARRALDTYNAQATLRASGSLAIDSGRTVSGDVAVHSGTLTVAGTITGNVVALNADLVLRRGARIEGDVLVVGGRIEGAEGATLAGDVLVFRRPIAVREDEDEGLVLDDELEVDRWFERWRSRHSRSSSGIKLFSANTYNRVEGLPIYFGPTLRQRTDWGRVTVEAYGIWRTAANFRWDAANLGHALRGEVAVGREPSLAVGGRMYDVVTPVEEWHLADEENGLSTFFLHRDFRDHFDRHGGTAYARLAHSEAADLTLSLSDQRWGARTLRDPWTLFRDETGWRPNPDLDEGRFHIATVAARVDTRNDTENPWAGWYVGAEFERGTGRLTRLGTRSDTAGAATGDITWHRGFLDLRRYNRLAPNAKLNLRLVVGGTLGGDPLPLNRRLSLGGPGTLPGYDFRRDQLESLNCTVSTVTTPAGRPAECERIALGQVEYRSDFGFEIGGADWRAFRMRSDGEWVVFANSGRGWLVGEREGDAQYRSGDLPPLHTFRTDIGTGIDFGGIGFFIAKSVTNADERANFVVRARRRF